MQLPVDVICLDDARVLAETLARAAERDVVLLAPGASLEPAAIEALGACARREPAAGTVSAMAGKLPASDGATAFARANAGIAVEAPFGLPACVYVTRRALAEAQPPASGAPPDMLAFHGRVSAAGLQHLVSGDAYCSVSTAFDAYARRWQEAIAADPRLRDEWNVFEARAPLTPLERRADIERLRASTRPRIVFVSHDWGGGVERHLGDLARLLADDCEILALRPGRARTVRLQWLREGEAFDAWFDASADWAACVDLLRALGVARVHFHHVHGLPRAVLELPRALGVAHDVTLHDHYPICPQYHLADAQGRYCGEPDEAGCGACLAKRPAQWNLDIAGWRAAFGSLLEGAERVIAPSQDMALRLRRYFPEASPLVWPHPEALSEPVHIHKVLLLGGVSAIKGMDLFEACVRDAIARRLPLHFHVMGHLSRPLAVGDDAPLTVSGSYPDARLASMVALERPDAFLFLSQVPESYSYTLSVAMRTGKPIVATDLGAFGERLRDYPAAALVGLASDAAAVNDALLRALRPPASLAPRLAVSVDR